MTPKQRDVLDAYRTLTVDGIAPPFEIVRQHCGLASKADVFRMVEALERQGHLICPRAVGGKRMARSIEVANPSQRVTDAFLDALPRDQLWSLHARVWSRLESVAA